MRILCERYFQGTYFSEHFLLFQKFRRRKSTRTALKFIFLVSQKFIIYKILNTLKPFWFNVDFSVLLDEEVQFFFHEICHFCHFFFVCVADCQFSRNLNPIFFQIFLVFLITGNFALYMSTMLQGKTCQFKHKHGDMTNSD